MYLNKQLYKHRHCAGKTIHKFGKGIPGTNHTVLGELTMCIAYILLDS